MNNREHSNISKTSKKLASSTPAVIECRSLVKDFKLGQQKVQVINGVDLSVVASERIAIMGPSGAGKTTLLNLLGGLDDPSDGKVLWAGEAINAMNNNQLARQRNGKIGFVYQFHHLLMEFSAIENVALPLVIGGVSPQQALKQAAEILDLVGLAKRLQHKPSELSGGERQRVAVARALVVKPLCLLMDEPTGNLDDATADAIHKLITSLGRKLKIAIIVVTHDSSLARIMDKKYSLQRGKLMLL